MKTKYNGNSKKSGVYKITNIINNRIYIGSAKRFEQRCKEHIKSLINGTHHNKFLQNDFNKCGGEEAFVFEVLEVVEGEQSNRFLAEQRHLDTYYDNQNMCYNFDKKTGKNSRSCFSKNPEDTKEKLSKASKRCWSDPIEREKRIEGKDGQRRKKIGEASKLAWSKTTEEQRKELSEKRKLLTKNMWLQNKLSGKQYTFISPAGEEIIIANITEWCRDNNLSLNFFRDLIRGRKRQDNHYNWKYVRTN